MPDVRTVEVDTTQWQDEAQRRRLEETLRRAGYKLLAYKPIGDGHMYEVVAVPLDAYNDAREDSPPGE